MTHIYGAQLLFVCNEAFEIIHNGAIAFESGEDRILQVAEYEQLCALYPHAKKVFYPHGVLLPALINAHIHFEFGAHLSTFQYGDFGKWLDSLMQHREDVLNNDTNTESIVTQGINEQLDSGVGSVGAISSYGDDMLTLAKSPLRVVYFNEAIGSNPGSIDMLFSYFLERLRTSENLASNTFIPAIALHSPYSLHPVMAQKLVSLAKDGQYPLSAHFLESAQENAWLRHNSGYFGDFFRTLMNVKNPSRFYTPESFLQMLSPLRQKTLSLVHCCFITDDEAEQIADLGASIITCPRSNRLLNNTYFPREILHKTNIPLALGTDGRSSNNNVNLLDELRAALYAYPKANLTKLAKSLLLSATYYGAKALGLNNGSLCKDKNVDFTLFDFPKPLFNTHNDISQMPSQFILHAHKPAHLYINAKQIK